MYITPWTFYWYWLSTKLHWTKTKTILRTFLHFLFCLLTFLCCHIMSLFQAFVFLAYIQILFWALNNYVNVNMSRRSCCWFFMFFMMYFIYILEYMTLNKTHLVIQMHHSTLELLFLVYCFCTAVLYISTRNK